MAIGLHVVDYVVFVLVLAVSVVIGLYYGYIKRQKTTSSYLTGDRKLQVSKS